jgi:hypothetical protein
MLDVDGASSKKCASSPRMVLEELQTVATKTMLKEFGCHLEILPFLALEEQLAVLALLEEAARFLCTIL